MSGYARGRRVEHAAVHALTTDGYDVTRAASSKGTADVLAFKHGQVVFVNVKATTMPGPVERADLLRVADLLPGVGVPVVALGPPSALSWRRLTGRGPGDWVPWTPDQIGAPA